MTQRYISGRRWCASYLRDSAVVALVLSCGLAWAVDSVGAARYRIDQPAQPLGESLRAIARQTGLSVLFDPGKVSGRTSKAVVGQLTAAEAINQALEGSGLDAIAMPDGSIVIRAPAAPSASPPSAPGGTSDRVFSADEDSSSRIAQGAAASDPSTVTKVEPAGPVTSLGMVEITGSRLKRIDADGATPVNVYTRRDIERSGQPTLERFISSLNEASVSPGEGGYGATTGQGSVQLRGLPLGSTLVLLNGRRLQAVGSSSGNFFNLNLIPMAAVERVEIVPVGSSAVYGGDALAGVVNIILKKSMDGIVFDARLGAAKGTGDQGLSLATGARSEAGSYLLLGSYSRTTPLTMAERAFFQDGDYRRVGGVDARTRACTPGTVTSVSGANLPGLNSSFAAIPANASGKTLAAADFAAMAGQANLCNPLANGHGTALVQGAEDFSLHAAGERRLSDAWSVFGELSLSKDRQGAEQSGLLLNNVLVPASNPYNPFGTAVRVTQRLGLENGAETLARDTVFKRALIGLRGEVAAGWDLEASASTTRDDGNRHLVNTSANVAARTAALAAPTLAAALNPFTTGFAASDDVLKSIWSDQVRENHGRKDLVSAFVRGSLLTLPTGSVDVIAGAEASHDEYQSLSSTANVTGSRSTSAFYGEARVPLWRIAVDAGEGNGPVRDLASLTLAARHDKYSDFGEANTYQAGLELRPARTLLLRGSAASSFKPPTLLETHVDPISYDASIFGLLDPARGGEAITGGEVARATNPNLRPETGRAYSLGAVWEPASALGTRFGLTAWRVRINGLISLLWPQVVLDNEALFPGVVAREPSTGGVPGPVTKALWTEVNFGRLSTAGADMEAAHSWKAAGGKWTLATHATRTTRYDVAISPDAPVDDRLGRRAADFWSPKWKGRVSIAFDHADWSLGLTSRYLGAYRDIAPSDRGLGNFWMHDLAASFNLKKLGLNLPAARAASLSLAVANLSNRMPEYASTLPYYDVTQADWRGRYASLRLSVTW